MINVLLNISTRNAMCYLKKRIESKLAQIIILQKICRKFCEVKSRFQFSLDVYAPYAVDA